MQLLGSFLFKFLFSTELLTDNDLLIKIDFNSFNFLTQSIYNDRFLSFKLIFILCNDRQWLEIVIYLQYKGVDSCLYEMKI